MEKKTNQKNLQNQKNNPEEVQKINLELTPIKAQLLLKAIDLAVKSVGLADENLLMFAVQTKGDILREFEGGTK